MRAHPRTRLPRSVPVGQMRRSLEAVQRFRLQFVFGTLLVIFLGLLGRLGKLQLVDAATWREEAARSHDARVVFRGLRGRILDARGRVLVASRRALRVAVDPAIVEDPVLFARRLAVMLDEDDGGQSILAAIRQRPSSRHVVLRPLVEDERVVPALLGLLGYTDTLDAGLRGLKVEVIERRTYPNGDYAREVLGFAPEPERRSPGLGLEQTFDAVLAGDAVAVRVARSGGRRPSYRASLAVDPTRAAGQDLVLTLDIVVQHYVEKALDGIMATWGPSEACAIVLEPATGHVLALANRFSAASKGRFNVAVHGAWPPGSIFKPLVVAHALDRGVVGEDERLELPTEMPFSYGRAIRVVHDVHATGEEDGCGTVVRIVGHSSNVGVAQLLWRVMAAGTDGAGGMSTRPAHDFLAGLGFERATGIELIGREDAIKDVSSDNPLFPALGFAFGQGIAVSPLRLLCCFAALGRDDARIVRPTLLPGRGGPRLDLPPVCRRREHLDLVRQGLADTVTDGTARAAFEGATVEVAGKTGTAEVLGSVPRQIAGFAGLAPRERPRLAVLVMANVDPEARPPDGSDRRPYGGNVAGPAVRQIVEQSLAYLDGRAREMPSVEGP